MPIISAAEFSRLAGVSKVAVSKAPPTKIHKEPDGKIDTDHPVNAVYLAEHTGRAAPVVAAKVAPKKGSAKKVAVPKAAKPKRQAEAVETDGDDLSDLTDEERHELAEAMGDDMATWTLRDKKASALLKEATERKVSLGHAVRKGELIERTQFVAAVQGINKAIDDHLHRVPAKLGPVLFALARREGATELEVIRALETDMGAAIRRATEDVARLAP